MKCNNETNFKQPVRFKINQILIRKQNLTQKSLNEIVKFKIQNNKTLSQLKAKRRNIIFFLN